MNFTVQCRIYHIWTSVYITQNLPILNIIHANTRQMPAWSNILSISLPPANEVCEFYVITLVCQSFCSRGEGSESGGVHRGGSSASRGVQWSLHLENLHSGVGLHPGGSASGGWVDPLSDTTGYGQRAGGTHPTGIHSYFSHQLASHFFALAFYQCERALLGPPRRWVLLHIRCPTVRWRDSPDVFRPRRRSKPCSPDLQQIWDLQ